MTNQPQTVTFGCRLNIYESEVMRSHAAAAGLKNAIIVNTCTVTAEAERQARQAIRKLRREQPDATIIVTGCAVQVNAERFQTMKEINHIIGNDVKLTAAIFQNLGGARASVNDIQQARGSIAPPVTGFAHGPRGFVAVQNGCDHRCTFCIIPFGRGPSRSAPIGQIVEQTRSLTAAGYHEITLTGVDIASYGTDLPGRPRLGQMIKRLLTLAPELTRLRLSSLDPAAIDDDLWRLIAEEPRLMPHLHLSLQAGDDMILKRMKRRHTRGQVIELCRRARSLRPGMTFGADLIAGFPTEDDAMFANSLRIVEECDLTWLHVFPYSPRSGTPAARMPQIDHKLRKARASELRKLGARQTAQHLQSMVGRTLDILVEQPGIGRTPHYAEIRFTGHAPAGAIVTAAATGYDDRYLLGKIVVAG